MGNTLSDVIEGLVWAPPAQTNDIEEECKTINTLLINAKKGHWRNVWEIIGTPARPLKCYLINVIPETRRRGILHYAVYKQDHYVIRQLLSFTACDTAIQTKRFIDTADNQRKVMTPKQIAKEACDRIALRLLRNKEETLTSKFVSTFHNYDDFNEQNGLGLISLTLASYKEAFHPEPVDPNKSISDVLKDIWNNINTSATRWKAIRNHVADAVYTVCKANSLKIKQSRNQEEFFKAIINTYTLEENYMYTYLSMAFRRQNQRRYEPTSGDLGIGPYAVVYQMLLLFWPKIPRESGTTYRRMLLKRADCEKYQIGTRFVWPSVVSSSSLKTCAVAFPTCGPSGEEAVMFTIDNSAHCMRQPRNIEAYATYTEHERTYPAGARFKVTGRSYCNGDITVSLRLLPY